jgi:hypothetical protein
MGTLEDGAPTRAACTRRRQPGRRRLRTFAQLPLTSPRACGPCLGDGFEHLEQLDESSLLVTNTQLRWLRASRKMSASRQSSPAPVSLSSASFATLPPHLRRTSYTTLSRSTSPDARSSSARSSRRSSLDGLVSLSLGGERSGGLSLAALLQYAALLLSIRSFLLAWPALSLTHASLALLSASSESAPVCVVSAPER